MKYPIPYFKKAAESFVLFMNEAERSYTMLLEFTKRVSQEDFFNELHVIRQTASEILKEVGETSSV